MNFTKVLCPTDFSPGADAALRAAARIAASRHAELVIVHAWQIPAISYSIEASLPPSLSQEIADNARRGLDIAVQDAKKEGAPFVTSKLLPGIAWAEIIAQLEREAFDLCVIGTHGRTGLSRVLLGSVAEKVVRHAPCPVLVVRPNNDITSFRHILVPTDFSTSASDALELAPQLVEASGRITVLHVLELPVSYAGEVSAELGRDLSKKAAARLEQSMASLRSSTTATIETRTRIGSPGSQVLAAVDDDRSIDLVVVGSRGRTGIKRVLLGSVAEKIVRHVHCPVLVAHRRS